MASPCCWNTLVTFKPYCPEVTDWLTKLFEFLENKGNTIGLVRWQIETFVDVFPIWTSPNKKHTCLNFATSDMAHRAIKHPLARTFEFP